MLDTKELQIGDWVYESKIAQFPMQVRAIGEDYCYLDFEENEGDMFDGLLEEMMPIPMTKVLFVQSGFRSTRENDIASYRQRIGNFRVLIDEVTKDVWRCHIHQKTELVGSFKFSYLHELQNGVRLITKKDLQIIKTKDK